ncbi:hypothetical protein E0493_12155 [Roseomonas sp. M0104]|uniref:Uncharacterized protein n=1 Tax=Teichococcus coralli TaxID=2545983 RepID=A0A845BFI4_9PROT|nr:hypothetical protein [Pseudoroseomonas coralli]MXP64097.1 hypothetical protein [Pseudoroseomonas coralli]
MKPDEKLAFRYLTSLSSDVLYEPDGNVPPDFLLDGHVAVEVTRLSQRYRQGDRDRSLEETAIPLGDRMYRLLTSLGPSSGQSWFVSWHFSRPIPDWKNLRPTLGGILQNFMQDDQRRAFSLRTIENFELDVFPASGKHADFFVPAGYDDSQSGGVVVAEIIRNLELRLLEKANKIAAFRSRYPAWWLILPDYIGTGLREDDQQTVREIFSVREPFNRVILLDPTDPLRAFGLTRNMAE